MSELMSPVERALAALAGAPLQPVTRQTRTRQTRRAAVPTRRPGSGKLDPTTIRVLVDDDRATFEYPTGRATLYAESIEDRYPTFAAVLARAWFYAERS